MRIKRIYNEAVIEVESKSVNLQLLDPIIEKYKNKKGNLIPILQAAQEKFGFIPKKAFVYISEHTGLKLSDMYGVATFYSQFRLKPVGKHIIKVCHGTACHVQNANVITDSLMDALHLEDGETTPDGLFTLETVACIGCCSLAPAMIIGKEVFGKLSGKLAVNVVKEIQLKEKN
jgi:NADH-quinone oxidoreductase subunit E